MIEENISFISNYFWKKSVDNINEILTEGQIKSFNMNDYYYLTVIYQLGTPKLGEVAEELHLTKPSISAMVQRLSGNGLVEKVQSDKDKRVFHLKLTSKGLKIVQGDYALYRNLAEVILNFLTIKQKSDAEGLLDMVVAVLKDIKSCEGEKKR
ncbi:MAG TPA: MarR family transcriptional regulator [Clostridia bacterium]|nr:MarR family transcriptional regulator [Clostridia bacterium]